MKKIIGGLGVIALLVVLFFGRFGFGRGDGEGDSGNKESSRQESVSDESSAGSGEVTVVIRESTVLIGDREFQTPEDLKAYVEEIHTDETVFRLEEDKPIQGTYEWVVKVFEELQVKLEK